MKQYIDLQLSLEVINFLIQNNRENLCWLMNHVSLERKDEWRDRIFKEISDKLNALVIEREVILGEMEKINDTDSSTSN